ncbi:MAG: efflux transporter outer membrane subunit [Desulfosalsimonadaceae bacterium]
MGRHPAAKAFFMILCLAASACMRLGPDYERPDTGIDIPKAYKERKTAKTRNYLPQDFWWREFDDPHLNRVVENALRGNQDISKAAASVSEAAAVAGQTAADQFPTLNLNSDASRREQSFVSPMAGGYQSVKIDSFSLTLPASYEIDLWGRLARATEAARAELLAAEKNRQAIAQSLVSEAAAQYFNIRYLQRQLDVSRELEKSYRQNLELIKARYRRGLASELELRQARRSLAQSGSEIPPLKQSIGKAQHKLAVLQGKYPEAETLQTVLEAGFELPPAIPAGLPSELLNRRPDIRAAEASLKAACAKIGAAKANRFPQISLTGSFGYTSEELDLLFEPRNQMWQVAADMVQPIFDAGKRKAAQRAAEARYEKQLAAYTKTVLEAFAEVEGALLTREQQIDRYQRLKAYLSEAEKTLNTALNRYQRGVTDYLNVLDAQQAKYQAELSLLDTQYKIYANRVSLYRALGGGWGSREALANQ